jgi:hypothetical protein
MNPRRWRRDESINLVASLFGCNRFGAHDGRDERGPSKITLKLLAYALGRPARYADMPPARAIVRDAEAGGYKRSSTILGIVTSAPIQMTRID